jgi:Cu2+-exporting ATPase
VAHVAALLGIGDWRADCTPADKARRLAELRMAGRKVLMIGDGLNDAPALAGAFASISPAAAADISRTAADLIFQGDRLGPVVEAISVARGARRLVWQNFALAALYNLVAVPVAVAGLVTPLIAAAAMSASSIAVTLNALRLTLHRRDGAS